MERLAALLLVASVTTATAINTPVELPEWKQKPASYELKAIPVLHPVDARFEMDARLLASVARAEDPKAPTAVMWVVINRARAWHKGDIGAAVTTGEAFGTRRNGIWEPINLNWPRNLRMTQLEGLAYHILLGKVKDPTRGATHFHRVGTWEPPWAPPMRERKMFGSHYFYKAMSYKRQQSELRQSSVD